MKNVIEFLRELERNNNREWFAEHKAAYIKVQEETNEFAAKLIEGIASFDDSVRGLSVKDCTYRIYRDTRFSKDKLPYKTHIGIYVSPGGKKSGRAGYYFHIEPTGNHFLGGHMLTSGLYMPEPKVLRSVREEIAYNGSEFLNTINKAKGFQLGTENSLKRIPTGFPTDSPYAEYLKLKDVYLEKRFGDDLLLSADLLPKTVEAYALTYDFVRSLNRAVDYAMEEM